jgi:hypothetical protein
MPQFYEEYLTLRGATLVFSGIVGVLTVITDLWLQRQLRQAEDEIEAEKRAESKASLKRRIQADALVRAQVDAGVKQVVDNLEAAWKLGYSAGDAAGNLAVELRKTAKNAARFEEQDVRQANYEASRYLTQDTVPDAQLGMVLDLDQGLLRSSGSLAQLSEGLYEQVNAGQVDPAWESLRQLRDGLNRLRNRFTERGAYLMDLA